MSSAISPAELVRLQASSEQWLSEQTSLERIGQTPDGKGGYVNGRTVIWSGLAKRKPMSESGREAVERDTGDLSTQLSHWIFTLPAGVDVRPQDELVASGRTFMVAGGIDKSIEIARYVIAVEKR